MIVDVSTFGVNPKQRRAADFELAAGDKENKHAFPIPPSPRDFTAAFNVFESNAEIKHDLVLSLLLWCDGPSIDHRGLVADVELDRGDISGECV